MKPNRLLSAFAALLLLIALSSCGPSFIGVRTGPHFGPGPWVGGGAWAGPGMWGPRVFRGPSPWLGLHRPPVIINRHFYGAPRYGYNNRSFGSPYGGGYGGNRPGPGYGGGSRGPR
ncbi:hypothetical protein [Fibrella aquatilis]|uniref:Lipoprotein n=1 Tax=Fibrella aquatilis TaxID=2817059 RepID=A0A939G8N2_9BACT|nr:hypothetical protein [Fibrella aquatilis]MBO0933886.1 hypothetical protein [Fibrella aquatilis]